jgi:UDP-3-O-[3-hydroxymyristoyl] glucosamine N-acyltransferase
MADPRFFRNAGPFRLGELAELTGSRLSENADADALIHDVAPLDVATREDVSFLDNPKYLGAFMASHAGTCFVHPKHAEKVPSDRSLLLNENPYLAYAQTATHFYPACVTSGEISPKAHIDPTATLGEGCEIAAGASISKHVIVGNHVIIGPNAVLCDGVTVGDGSRIGANATLSHTLVGKRAIIHPGVCIGQDGFGFAKSDHGAIKVPQLGRVLIEDDVEIGAGTCIDRGAGPDTIIGMGSKIDNLVQIGHNVRVGRFSIIVSQAGISGSTEIGDGTTIAGQVGIAGHLKIGRGATLAAKAGVHSNIPDGAIYGGFPAVPIMEWRRQAATLSMLTKKKKDKGND